VQVVVSGSVVEVKCGQYTTYGLVVALVAAWYSGRWAIILICQKILIDYIHYRYELTE